MTLSPEHSTRTSNPGEVRGYIHSIETCGTVDGPGLRFVVFTQGCPMRCLYCHNPDTWAIKSGNQMSVAEILTKYESNASFYHNGGLTVTGGEPMMQMDFVIALFEEAKKKGIHTCIDTSGICFSEEQSFLEKLDRLLNVTNLVMLDIKHIEPKAHKELTGQDNGRILRFAEYLDAHNVEIWIRHVIVEGYTDDPQEHRALGHFIGGLKNVKALDVLPYHGMGEVKYEQLGMDYPLKGMENMDKEKAIEARKQILLGMKIRRLADSKK